MRKKKYRQDRNCRRHEMKNRTSTIGPLAVLAVCGLTLSPGISSAQEPEVYHLTEDDFIEERVYSPYAGRAYADQVFFGDMHCSHQRLVRRGAHRNDIGCA